jgi:Lhr-like helicase
MFSIRQRFHDKDLAGALRARWMQLSKLDNVVALASVGIAVHHAGLNTDDRRAVEELFLRKALRVLVATSVWYSLIYTCCSHCPVDPRGWR